MRYSFIELRHLGLLAGRAMTGAEKFFTLKGQESDE